MVKTYSMLTKLLQFLSLNGQMSLDKLNKKIAIRDRSLSKCQGGGDG